MKRILFILLIFPFICFSQIQIGEDIDGEAQGDESGWSVSTSYNGNIIAIGARSNDGNGFTDGFGYNSGQVRVFENIGNHWIQVGQDIDGLSEGDALGHSVSLSSNGNRIIIGSISNDYNGDNSGQIVVYENINNVWTQIGQKINGEAEGDLFGYSVDVSSDGNIIAISGTYYDGNGSNSGFVRIYQLQNNSWTQIGQDIFGESDNDHSGYSINLSLNGNIIAIGAPDNRAEGTSITKFGHTRVYQNINNVWTQIGQDIDGDTYGDESGSSVNLSSNGDFIAIGAIGNSVNANHSGRVRIFEKINNNWVQKGQSLYGDVYNDEFGTNAKLSSDGTILAVSSDGSLNNPSFVRIFKWINNSWVQQGQDIIKAGIKSINLSSDASTLVIGVGYNNYTTVYDLSTLLSINEFLESKILIYPNPTSTFLNIELLDNSEFKKVIIYNNLGQLISEENQLKINVSKYSKGIYFANINTAKGKIIKKFIIE
ncbi:T9SS type A sorting domain-containing protein [Lacinutrix cladophorae]